MLTPLEILELDPEAKTVEWANGMIQSFRESWSPIVNPDTARENMRYLLNTQSQDFVKAMFKDHAKTKLSFIKLAAFEKLRNILTAERDKAGVFIGLNAIDPSVLEADRKRDRDLLKNRKSIEAVVSTLNAKIGEPPYKLQNEEFKGNVESFDEIGLNDEDDEDMNYFFATHWRLTQEIKGQLPLNFFVKYNDLQSNIAQWCNDIIAKKAIAAQVFIDQSSGAIKYEYLAPEEVYAVWGSKKTFKDAQCLGWQKAVTVHELIRHIGSDFNPETDYRDLINAINLTHSTAYTGLYDRMGSPLFTEIRSEENKEEHVYCDWNQFTRYKLTLGYIEFKSVDGMAVKRGKSVHGNEKVLDIKIGAKVDEKSHYVKEVYTNEVTRCAYFYPTSSYSQRIYRYGKLFHQTIEGGEDELSNFSICCYKEVGPPAIEVAQPYIDLIQEAWTKFQWMVRKAKPQGRTYNYEVLVQIATAMISEGNSPSVKVQALMNMFEEGINDIYTMPTVNGERVGGGGNPYFDKPNGLDKSAKEFMGVIQFAFARIADDLGTSPLSAESPSPNDGYKIQQAAIQQARMATEYMSTMLLNMFNHMGMQTLLMCQDIIKFKTSIPYKFLVNAIGQDTVNTLAQSDFPHARLGIFIETFNTDQERKRQRDLTEQAFLKGEIPYEVMMMINSIDDHRKAGMQLAFEKKKAEKRKQQEVQQLHENVMQQQQQKSAAEMALQDLKNKGAIAAKKMEGTFYADAHKYIADAQIEKKQMDIDNSEDKIAHKTEGDIKKEQAKRNFEEQNSLV